MSPLDSLVFQNLLAFPPPDTMLAEAPPPAHSAGYIAFVLIIVSTILFGAVGFLEKRAERGK